MTLENVVSWSGVINPYEMREGWTSAPMGICSYCEVYARRVGLAGVAGGRLYCVPCARRIGPC